MVVTFTAKNVWFSAVFCVCLAAQELPAQDFSNMFVDRQLLTNASVTMTGSNSNATVEPHVDADIAGLGKLERVADQIHQNLPQVGRVALNSGRGPRRNVHRESESLVFGRAAQRVHDAVHDLSRIERDRLEIDLAGASIFEKSRISLMSESSECAESRTVTAYSC